MGVVAAARVLEVAAVAVIVWAVLAHKTLVAGPGLDEGAADAEVPAREQAFVLGLLQHPIEEFDDGAVLDQPLVVLGEGGGHPHGVVHGQADEPAEQEVVLGLLHELAFGAEL